MINAPILIIAIPLLSAFLIHLTKYTRFKRAAELLAILALLGSGLALFSTIGHVFSGEVIYYDLGSWPAPFGISLAIDPLSFFFAAMSLGIGLMIIIYSLGEYFYARRYYSLLLIALTGILGIILTRDLFNMYVFFEMLAVASYVLVTYKHKARTIVASFKYLIITEAAWVFFLLAIALLYVLCGSLNMDSIANIMPLIYHSNQQTIWLVFAIMMVCFGIKSGMFPLHTWIPEVHSQAPTAVSSLLSGLILKVGLYAMLRTFYLFFGTTLMLEGNVSNIIILFGVVTVVFGACMALVQNELKRLLAYSSINQIGFILVGIGLGTELGLTGALFHIFNHAIIKVGLFFCAGIIISQIGFWEISRMKGVWHKMPAATFAFCLLSLAVIGIPPFNGFVSKMFIVEAALLAGNYWLLLPLFLGIILTAAYYFRVIQTFFSPQEFKRKEDFVPTPVGPFEHFSTFFLVGLCLLVGLFPQIVLNIIQPAVKVLLP